MSFTKGGSAQLSDDQVKEYILDLPAKRRLALMEELQQAGVKAKWEAIFAAFKPNQVTQRAIDREVKAVRAKRQARRRGEAASGRR
ncbi:MAG: hypothetical protein IPJ76_16340 [Flavobacteriales bacterium]|nr:MAG: hypothetical protein IPJ76_16340 [Flavobacteriales bacterium]